MESFEQWSSQFKYPILEEERGEFDRVSALFNRTTHDLLSAAEHGTMVDLDEHIWEQLENTDSHEIGIGEWDTVASLSEQTDRNWQNMKTEIESGKSFSAPIVMKFGEKYHLVAGNTRLMVSRALGIVPKVLLFNLS